MSSRQSDSGMCSECRQKLEGCSIILMTSDDNTTHKGKISFDLGLTSLKHTKFTISNDGTDVTFKESGLYLIHFKGVLSSNGLSSIGIPSLLSIQIKKSPDFSENQKPFSVFEASSGIVNDCTIIPVKRGETLSMIVTSANGRVVATGKGTKIVITRVGGV